MQHFPGDSQSSHVTALFADRTLSFGLKQDATLEDLVHRLIFPDGRKPLAVIANWAPTASSSTRQLSPF
jgi:hypothetical protein